MDNLQPDFLYDHIQPVRAELMQVIVRGTLHMCRVYHCSCSHIFKLLNVEAGVCIGRAVGVVGCVCLCVSLASFFVLFLHFSLPFLSQYSAVLYARDCSCTCTCMSICN